MHIPMEMWVHKPLPSAPCMGMGRSPPVLGTPRGMRGQGGPSTARTPISAPTWGATAAPTQ